MNSIQVVGIGPGAMEDMTEKARRAIVNAQTVVGYDTYIQLIASILRPNEQTILQSGMMQEVQRCTLALQEAEQGREVAMICSGDAGIYGMAGLLFEMAEDRGEDVNIEVVAGITAACSGAAVLGAPLSNDFCVISLSDLLTPQAIIDRRLQACGMGDFCCVIYNPMSKKRPDKLKNACDQLLQHRSPNTVCGWVRNIGREGERAQICTLETLREAELDMFTTVFIGNSQTKAVHGKMVTQRGYQQKYTW